MPSGTQAGLQRLMTRSQKRRERHRARLAERSTNSPNAVRSFEPEEVARLMRMWRTPDVSVNEKGWIIIPVRKADD